VSERHEYRTCGVHRDSAGYRAGLEKAQRKELEKREQSFLATQQDPSQAVSAEAGARFLRIWQYERPGFGTGGSQEHRQAPNKRIIKRTSKTVIHQHLISTKKLTKTHNNKYAT
jgi:hypothetical protein